jgi:hypothetical protein
MEAKSSLHGESESVGDEGRCLVLLLLPPIIIMDRMSRRADCGRGLRALVGAIISILSVLVYIF